MKLHPEWPEVELRENNRYNLPDPYADIYAAFEEYPTFQTAEPVSARAEAFGGDAVASVTDYYIASGGEVWKPGGTELWSELEMVLVGKLEDGRWYSLAAWNDYTGWGCQAGCDIRVGATRGDVVAYGLDDRERELLGVTV